MKKKSKYDGKFQIGQKFGKWIVINTDVVSKHTTMVLCKCECGTEKLVSIFTLLRGASIQCRKCADKTKNFLKPSDAMIREIKRYAEKHDISYELSDDDVISASNVYVSEKERFISQPVTQQYSACAVQTNGSIPYSVSGSQISYTSGAMLFSPIGLIGTNIQTSNFVSSVNAGMSNTFIGDAVGIWNSQTTATKLNSSYIPTLYRIDDSKGYTIDNTVIVNKNDIENLRNSTSLDTTFTSSQNIQKDSVRFKLNSTLSFLNARRDTNEHNK